jgi:hypothetical protein
MLTQSRLKELIVYDAFSGHFLWKVSRGRVIAGKRAGGNPPKSEYRGIRVDGRAYYEHRLAFLYTVGEWPMYCVDHKDEDKHNNAWSNLRDVPSSDNLHNVKSANSSSKTGVRGVHKIGEMYCVQLMVNRRRETVGRFASVQEAEKAYLKRKEELCSLPEVLQVDH